MARETRTQGAPEINGAPGDVRRPARAPQPLSGITESRFMFPAALAAIVLLTCFAGAAPTVGFGHDIIVLLDNGWQVVNGHRPQVDYYSAFGPVTFLAVALPMKVISSTVNCVGYANAITAFLLGIWAYGLGRNRLRQDVRALFAISLALLASAPFALGTWPWLTTHAMVYNRYGYAFLTLVIAECVQSQGAPLSRAESLWGGISTGAATALALFLKASFGLVCLPFIFVSLLFGRPNGSRVLGLASGFAAVTLALMAYLRFDLTAVIASLRMAAGARVSDISPLMGPLRVILDRPLEFGPAVALAAVVLLRWGGGWRVRLGLAAFAALAIAGDAALILTNCQWHGALLLAAFALMVAGQALRPAEPPLSTTARRLALALCALLFAPQFGCNAFGLGVAALRKAWQPDSQHALRFTSARLAPLVLFDNRADPPANGANYVTYVNDGVALLRSQCGPNDRVITADMANPFPYALGWFPARAGMSSISPGNTFSLRYHPTAEAFFGDATVVMAPKRPAAPNPEVFMAAYGQALRERFRLAAETDWWRLYKRK
jgi:hypothetical protein